jgi:hypothetical protein
MQRNCVTCRRPIRPVRDSRDHIVYLDARPDPQNGNVLLVEPGVEEELYHRRAGQPVVLNEGAALAERGQGRDLYTLHRDLHGCEAVQKAPRPSRRGR